MMSSVPDGITPNRSTWLQDLWRFEMVTYVIVAAVFCGLGFLAGTYAEQQYSEKTSPKRDERGRFTKSK